MRAREIAAHAAPILLLVTGGCRGESAGPRSDDRPAVSATTASASAVSVLAPPASVSAASVPGLPPLRAIQPACCQMDRTEGIFGSEKGLYTRYSGDFVRRKDGERLLFPQDLISDTKELYQHAKSAGKSVEQTRRVKVVGEGARYVSVEIVDQGETGVAPFSHSSCKTVDLMSGRVLKLEDILKEKAATIVAEGRKQFDASPGRDGFRFLASSFALVGLGETTVRFCAPRKDETLGGARLDVEVAVTPLVTRYVASRPRTHAVTSPTGEIDVTAPLSMNTSVGIARPL